MKSILQLPVDILIHILINLRLSDLYNVMLTCKRLKQLVINEKSIWRNVCNDRLLFTNAYNRSRIKMSFHECCRISNNWYKGIYRNKVIINHKINYIPYLSFPNSEALLLTVGRNLHCYGLNKNGLPNGNALLWVLHSPMVDRADIRTNDITRFIVKKGVIVSGNRDGCAALYEYCEIKKKPILRYHVRDCHEAGTNQVSTVELIDNSKTVVITGSNESEHVKFWNCVTENCVDNITENAMATVIQDGIGVRCLALNEVQDKLAIGLNGNRKPLLLDINMNKFLMLAGIAKHEKQLTRDIQWYDPNTILYVTHSGDLELIDCRSHETVYQVKDPLCSTLYCVKSYGNHAIIAGSSEYARCVLYDARKSPTHVQMYFTNKRSSPVYSLDFDPTKLITAVDRAVSVLNFNVGVNIEKKDYSDTIFYSK